jgi:hypothetical protein
MQHLVGDLNVPAVIAALPSADLKALFDNYGYGQPANVFVVNPFGADSTLTALTRGQQFWHMLGAPGDTAPVYQPLLARVEAYVRTPSSTLSTTSQPWGLGSGSLRVAAVTANATVLTDLASAVLPTLSWNHGSDQAISGDSNFDSEKISDSVLNSSSASPDVSAAVAGILAFQPHVIVSFASDEFVTLLQTVEIKWPNSVPWKPVWILSPYNFQNAGLVVWANSLPAKLSRLVGVNVASTTNSVTANYNTNFVAANPTLSTDFNNCYDATYFAVDSLVAASNLTTRPFAGDDLGQGMLRLISVAGTPYDMGSGDIDHVSASLTTSSNASIELIGTLGDPIFSTQTGARITQGDVYCLEVQPPSQGGGAPSTVYVPDAMRLVVPGDGGVPTLTGTPCFSGL